MNNMSDKIKKPGRPKVDDNREFLHTVTFKADKTTREAIAVLKAVVISEGGSVSGAKSIAIRRALVEAAERTGLPGTAVEVVKALPAPKSTK